MSLVEQCYSRTVSLAHISIKALGLKRGHVLVGLVKLRQNHLELKSRYSASRYPPFRLFLPGQSDESEGLNLKFCMVEAVHMTFPVVVNPYFVFNFVPGHIVTQRPFFSYEL
jgi:hypothetical protein